MVEAAQDVEERGRSSKIISMIRWNRTSRLSIKNSVFVGLPFLKPRLRPRRTSRSGRPKSETTFWGKNREEAPGGALPQGRECREARQRSSRCFREDDVEEREFKVCLESIIERETLESPDPQKPKSFTPNPNLQPPRPQFPDPEPQIQGFGV